MSRVIATALLMCSALLATVYANAQPRSEVEVSREAVLPVTEPAAMAEWLRRLVGRFRFEGTVQLGIECMPPVNCVGIKGTGDCIAIGTGPGVQCILNVTWQDLYQVNFEGGTVDAPPGAVSYLDPAMALFGLDPGKSALSYLLVDNKGLPEGGPGFIAGDRATFKTACVNVTYCERTIRIDAKPDTNLLFMRIDIESYPSGDPISAIVLSLRHVPQTQVDAAPEKQAASR